MMRLLQTQAATGTLPWIVTVNLRTWMVWTMKPPQVQRLTDSKNEAGVSSKTRSFVCSFARWRSEAVSRLGRSNEGLLRPARHQAYVTRNGFSRAPDADVRNPGWGVSRWRTRLYRLKEKVERRPPGRQSVSRTDCVFRIVKNVRYRYSWVFGLDWRV